MKFNYAFSNLLGTVYKQGNVLFSPDGSCLYSPVGNRVSAFDLINNKSWTFPFENGKNIAIMALTPNGQLLLTVDEDGRAVLANVHRRCVLHRMSFKSAVTALKFSPCGKFFAVGLRHKNCMQIWRTPLYGLQAAVDHQDESQADAQPTRDFSPFVLHRTLTGHCDLITMIQWSADSRWLLTAGKDMTMRMYSRDPVAGYRPLTLSGHKDTVVGAWWSEGGDIIYSVSRDGACFTWVKLTPEKDEDGTSGEETQDRPMTEGHIRLVPGLSRYKLQKKNYFNQSGAHGPARVKSAEFHSSTNLLVIGFSTGVFGLYEMPDFNNIHTLSISQKKIDALAVSPSGDWLAFASGKLGQLLVWEWQSESYILKQQGHYYDLNCLSFSPDGQHLATGGDDGKIKLWSTQSGFCFVTFVEHSGAITALEFAGKQGGKQGVVFSASLDGTVRAFDLIRYRNFRTFTSPHPVQFNCLAVDPSGEIVCAGSKDTFEIFVWSVQTGRLLDVLSGHEGPISSMAFTPDTAAAGTTGANPHLVTASWDKTVKVWDIFSRGTGNKCTDTFAHRAEVLAVAYRPDGREICSASMDGLLSFWDPVKGGPSARTTELEGSRDIQGGRRATDIRTARSSAHDKHFTSLCYSADGSCLLAGGNAKWVCLYDIGSNVLLKRFQLSKNLSMDGMLDKLNSKRMTDAGPLDLIDADVSEPSDIEDRLEQQNNLPGVRKGDMSLRRTRPEIRCKWLRFDPTGRQFAAASTEGLVLYSMDDSLIFDPYDLDMDVTPQSVLTLVQQASTATSISNETDWIRPLVMAMRLNEPALIQYVYERVPVDEVPLVAAHLPRVYLNRLLQLIAQLLEITGKPPAQASATTDAQNNATNTNDGNNMNALQPSPYLEFHLLFIQHLLMHHGRHLKQQHHTHAHPTSITPMRQPSMNNDNQVSTQMALHTVMRLLKKAMQQQHDDLQSVSANNQHLLRYLFTSTKHGRSDADATGENKRVAETVAAE